MGGFFDKKDKGEEVENKEVETNSVPKETEVSRPQGKTYKHHKCGHVNSMSKAQEAELKKNPKSALFCSKCRAYCATGEFDY